MSQLTKPPLATLDYARPGTAASSTVHVSSLRRFTVALLLAAGPQAWILLGRSELGERRQVLAAVVAAALGVIAWVVPAIRERVLAASARMADPSSRAKYATAITIALLATVYLYATARGQHRDFAPVLHDEYAYVLQARMLAGGHLWMPKHELSDFFENFHLVTDRVYASKYGPGTALWYAPAALLHLPPWITPLLLSGAAAGLMYLLAAELFGGASGLLAALVLVSLGAFRRTSIMMMSQAPVLALLLLAMLAFVYWRQKRCGGCMVLLGVCVGWAAITRPVDALCLAVPLAVAVLVELWRADNRTRVRTIALGLAGVAPFIVLQAVYNKGVTGSVTTLPWNYYALRYDPYDTMGRKPLDTPLMPPKLLPQKQAIIDEFTRPMFEAKARQSAKARLLDRTTKLLAGPPLEEQEPGRLIYGALPTPLLVALLPVGLVALLGRRRWMFLVPLVLFLAIYANYSYFFPHYTVAVLPAVILLVLAAPASIGRTWPRLAAPAGLAIGLVIAAVSVTALPQVNRARHDQWFDAPLLRGVDAALASISKRPAIVLFKYDPERSIHEEPVYNASVAWPDDAEVIRAHDLGERNGELLAYYAKRSPAREVYRFDEKDQKLTDLGNVADLSRSQAAH
jgi:hypothetical protein